MTIAILVAGSACERRSGPRDDPVHPAPLAVIPFPERNGHVFLPVSLAHRPAELWNLDSGFQTSVVAARTAQAAGVPVRERAKTVAPGGSVDLGWAGRLCVDVATVPFCADSMASIPLEGLEYLIGDRFHGILGHDFFQRFVVRIDYRRRVVSLYDPATFHAPDSTPAVPVFVEQGEPFFVGTLYLGGRATPAKLKIDTGSLDFMGLNGSFVAQSRLIPDGHRRTPAPGVAVGGATENWVTRLDSVSIGGLPTFLRPPIGYSASLERVGDAGTVGARLLSRFTVTFDYARRRLLVEAAAPPDETIPGDASGSIVGAPDPAHRARVVVAIATGGPADRAGLLVGDSILTLDGRPAAAVDLFALRRLFERPDTTYHLGIARGSTHRSVELRTAPWP